MTGRRFRAWPSNASSRKMSFRKRTFLKGDLLELFRLSDTILRYPSLKYRIAATLCGSFTNDSCRWWQDHILQRLLMLLLLLPQRRVATVVVRQSSIGNGRCSCNYVLETYPFHNQNPLPKTVVNISSRICGPIIVATCAVQGITFDQVNGGLVLRSIDSWNFSCWNAK